MNIYLNDERRNDNGAAVYISECISTKGRDYKLYRHILERDEFMIVKDQVLFKGTSCSMGMRTIIIIQTYYNLQLVSGK